jgi:hypothetical protein
VSRSFYEIQYGVSDSSHLGGLKWFTACNGNGEPYRYDNITPARAALATCAQSPHRWRLVRVEEIRTPCV